MPRSYVHVKLIEKEIFEMKAAGKSNRKIREQYGLSEKQLKNLITRHNRAEERLQAVDDHPKDTNPQSRKKIMKSSG